MGVVDVVVVGAGVMGSASAFWNSKAGKSVVLIEQYDLGHRRGSSHGESRITRLAYPDKHMTKMMMDAYPLWEAVEQEAGTRVFTKSGGLDIGTQEQIQPVVDVLRHFGIHHTVLSPQQVRDKFNVSLSPEQVGLFQEAAGVLNASKCVAVFQDLARKHGCEIHDNEQVADFVFEEDLEAKEGNSLIRVVTSKGVYVTHKVVISAGAWTAPLCQLMGLQLDLQVVQTNVAYFKNHPGFSPQALTAGTFPCVLNYNKPHAFCLPALEYPGFIKIGAHFGEVTTAETRTFLPDGYTLHHDMPAWVRQHFPGVNPTPAFGETCLYTNTPDENFLVDFHPSHPNVLILGGFSGHGFKHAVLIGKLSLDLLDRATVKHDLSYHSINRLLSKKGTRGDAMAVPSKL